MEDGDQMTVTSKSEGRRKKESWDYTSSVWDPNGCWIKGDNPRSRVIVPRVIPNLEENLGKISSLRKKMDTSRLKEKMTKFRSKSLTWHEEFRNGNDPSQVLDLLVCHGKPAQSKSRHLHRREGFKTPDEIKREQAEAERGGKNPKNVKQVNPTNTHTRAVKTARVMRSDIAAAVGGGSDTPPSDENEIASPKSRRPRSEAARYARDATVFGGFHLNYLHHTNHPVQIRTAERFLRPFKDIDYRPSAEFTDLNQHVENRYLRSFDAFQESKVWPCVRFSAYAKKDHKIMRQPQSAIFDADELEPEDNGTGVDEFSTALLRSMQSSQGLRSGPLGRARDIGSRNV